MSRLFTYLLTDRYVQLERCNRDHMLPIAILSRAYGGRSPRSHYDVILIVTSFATELATTTVTDERTLRTPYRV